MHNIAAILFRREFASYFATPLALVFIVIFLVLAGAFTFYLGGFYERGQADLAPFFNYHPWLYLFLMPGAVDAAVGRGAQVRHDRAADDAAGHAVAGGASASTSPRGRSPASRSR